MVTQEEMSDRSPNGGVPMDQKLSENNILIKNEDEERGQGHTQQSSDPPQIEHVRIPPPESDVGAGMLSEPRGRAPSFSSSRSLRDECEFVMRQVPAGNVPPSPPRSPKTTRVRVFQNASFEDSVAEGPSSPTRSIRDTFLKSTRKMQTAPRLIPRNLDYHQSHNQFNVKNKFGRYRLKMMWNLYRQDWFHVVLRWPTWVSAFFLIIIWTGIILIFAGLYIVADKVDPNVDCGLNPDGFEAGTVQWHTAFAFSLETCTTVGYGLPGSSSAFFYNCPSVQVAIYFQMLVSMMFNAFLLAFFFSRLGRCETRAYQVVFSDKACIRRDYTHGDGRVKFECKVYDADARYPVVEAHVRMYVVHCRSPSRNYSPLRITLPNDELGAMLCTSIPSHVSHHIDLYSPLLPPQFRPRNLDQSFCNIVTNSGLSLREVDSYTGNRDGIICPVCCESYGTFERFKKHVRYNKMLENYCDIPEKTLATETHHILDDATLQKMKDSISLEGVTYEDINRYWQETKMEVVVIVEGIDPITSGTFQALHSYQAEDIFYGGKFAVSFTAENEVDFDLFQTVELVKNPLPHLNDTNTSNRKKDL
jgi:hypothetical protein